MGPTQGNWCPYKKKVLVHTNRHKGCVCTGVPGEDTIRSRSVASPAEGPQKKAKPTDAFVSGYQPLQL